MPTLRTFLTILLFGIAFTLQAQDNLYLKSGEVISAYNIVVRTGTIVFNRADKPGREFEVETRYVNYLTYRNGITEHFGADSLTKALPPQPVATPGSTAVTAPIQPAPLKATAQLPSQAPASPANSIVQPTPPVTVQGAAPPAQPQLPTTTAYPAPALPLTDYQLLSADMNSLDYQRGKADGERMFTGYRDATLATGLTTALILPFYSLPVPIITSLSKVPVRKLGYIAPPDNTNVNYVAGYKAGASKKKSNRIWRTYGIVAGIMAVAVVAIVAVVIVSFSRRH